MSLSTFGTTVLRTRALTHTLSQQRHCALRALSASTRGPLSHASLQRPPSHMLSACSTSVSLPSLSAPLSLSAVPSASFSASSLTAARSFEPISETQQREQQERMRRQQAQQRRASSPRSAPRSSAAAAASSSSVPPAQPPAAPHVAGAPTGAGAGAGAGAASMSAPPPGGVAGGAKANSGGKVVDVNLNNFRQVVESESAVIIMCTSARAAAAQALQATLTEEVMRSSSLILALVNVDRETEIAKQLQIRTVPTVVALFRGQMVDHFEGVPDAQRLTQFFDAVAACDSATYLQSVVRKADEALDRREVTEAAPLFNQLLAEKASRPAALAGLARCAVLEGQVDVAESLLAQLRSEYADLMSSPFVRKAVAAVELASCVESDTPPLDQLELTISQQAESQQAPANPKVHFQYATRLLASDRLEEGIEQLLRVVRLDREWEEGKAKTLLFKVFNSLGAKHELTVKGRKRLSNLLF